MSKHCCERMDLDLDQRCDQHPNRFDCADALIHHWPEEGIYGLIVHDGGSSFVQIAYCPWCGSALSPNRRESDSRSPIS